MISTGAFAPLMLAAAVATGHGSVAYEVPPDGKVALTIDGRPVTALSTPGMPSRIYIARTLARAIYGNGADRFAQPGGLFAFTRSTGARVGPVRIAGRMEDAAIGFDGQAGNAGVQWFETDAYPQAEALAGPYALPAPVVRYRLHAGRPGERTTTVPLAGRTRWWIAITTRTVAGKTVAFGYAPHFPRTVASAAAGAAIARDHGGRFTGDVERVVISHGVERPARLVTLATPLMVGGVRIDRLLVRTRDYGSTDTIADASEIDPAATDEIVVTGRRKGSPPSYVVYVGADSLAACSSITYDKAAATIAMSCTG